MHTLALSQCFLLQPCDASRPVLPTLHRTLSLPGERICFRLVLQLAYRSLLVLLLPGQCEETPFQCIYFVDVLLLSLLLHFLRPKERGGELPEETLPSPVLPPSALRHLLPRVRLLPARGRRAPSRPNLRSLLRLLPPLHLRQRQRYLRPPCVPADAVRQTRDQAWAMLPRVHRWEASTHTQN